MTSAYQSASRRTAETFPAAYVAHSCRDTRSRNSSNHLSCLIYAFVVTIGGYPYACQENRSSRGIFNSCLLELEYCHAVRTHLFTVDSGENLSKHNSIIHMGNHVFSSFLGALQASLAVLLTMSYGVTASRCNLLKERSSRDISKTCVRLFLPALLITNVGSELHVDTALRYIPVLSGFP